MWLGGSVLRGSFLLGRLFFSLFGRLNRCYERNQECQGETNYHKHHQVWIVVDELVAKVNGQFCVLDA
jgi:hypothetical protein